MSELKNTYKKLSERGVLDVELGLPLWIYVIFYIDNFFRKYIEDILKLNV